MKADVDHQGQVAIVTPLSGPPLRGFSRRQRPHLELAPGKPRSAVIVYEFALDNADCDSEQICTSASPTRSFPSS